jgi:nucleoside-diphosphate-sugar epimerase/membrane protease YdiL (CAAX protease family)
VDHRSGAKTVLVAGGTGFIGREVATRLAAAGHRVVVLGRRRASVVDGVELRRCDLAHAVCSRHSPPLAVPIDASLLAGVDVLINCVGIKRERKGQLSWERAHVELPGELAEAAAAAGVARMIQISVAGCEGATAQAGPYLHSKARGEQRLAQVQGVEITILRPGVVYGRGDDVLRNLADSIRAAPVFPAPGAGRAVVQTIAVEDVAEAVLRCVERSGLAPAYALVGPERASLRELVGRVAGVVGRSCIVVPAPMLVMRPAAAVLERFGSDPLVTRSQLGLLARGVVGDPEPARVDLGFEPRPLDEAAIENALIGFEPRLPSVRLSPDRTAERELDALGGRRPSWVFAAFAVLAVVGLLLGPMLPLSIWLRMGMLETLLSAIAIAALGLAWAKSWRPSASLLAWGVGAGLVMWAGALAVAALLSSQAPTLWAETGSLYAWAGEHPLAMTVPLLILIVAGEEIVWRGALGIGLASRIGAWPAVAVSATLFCIAHLTTGPPVLALAALLAGAAWTWLAIRTRSLVASFVAHLGWDIALIWLTPLG